MKHTILENIVPTQALANSVEGANDGTKLTGSVIDRRGYQSAVIVVAWGAATSGSDSKCAIVLEDAAEVGFNVTNATFVTLAAAKDVHAVGLAYYNVNLISANAFIRVTLDITYGDGSSPKNPITAIVILGDKNIDPAGSTTVSDGS